MILNPRESMVAYRCPYCGSNVVSMVGVFALSGDMIKLKCSCGNSELTITYTGDNKIRLNVPCIVCPKPHNYVISKQAFFERDLFTIVCTYSSVDVCFIGKKASVEEALERSNDELEQMMNEAGLDDFDVFHENPNDDNKCFGDENSKDKDDDYRNDAMIDDVMRFMIADLAEDNAIECLCEDNKGEYNYFLSKENVIIYCEKCKFAHTLKMSSLIDADSFLGTNKIVLDEKLPE